MNITRNSKANTLEFPLGLSYLLNHSQSGVINEFQIKFMNVIV